MAGQNCSCLVDQDRIGEAKPLDAVGNLPDLSFRVGACIALRGTKIGDRQILESRKGLVPA
jgi:hypothetical protein